MPKWDNGIGKAIGVNGGDVTGVARILDPAQVSPQIAQFIELTQELTQSNLGATSVALGDARPDNTSAIVALQRAAATPNELTRQSLYRSVEDWAPYTRLHGRVLRRAAGGGRPGGGGAGGRCWPSRSTTAAHRGRQARGGI